jgi:hypothetical protein
MSLQAHLELPRLRRIEPRFVRQDGQDFYALIDPHQLKTESLLLPAPLGPLLVLCDGTRSSADLKRILFEHFELDLNDESIEYFVRSFDDMLLLDNQAAQHAITEKLAQFRAGPFRPPVLAGPVYPADAAELHRYLNDQLESASAEPLAEAARGLLSPHIDFVRGKSVYAEVWKRSSAALLDADLIVIFGTDHRDAANPITLTRQNYATPHGTLETDQHVVSALAQEFGEDLVFKGELNHASEHSIELVCVWLKHMLGGREVPVLPVLTGVFDQYLYGEALIAGDPFLQRFERVLRLATQGRKVFYVISGDLAHVGPAFNGEALDDAAKAHLAAADAELLERLVSLDADHFYDLVRANGDANNVCGTLPLYFGLRMMDATAAEQVAYLQCPADAAETSVVSIGGIVFS